MLNEIATAIDQQEYRQAAQLVKAALRENPRDPWARFYAARLQEAVGKREEAAASYRKLLPKVTIPKLVSQIRQGLQRLETARQAEREAAIAQAKADPRNAEPGFLVLEPVQGAARQAAALSLADVMGLDAYTARMTLPSTGWRLYRLGAIGELALYGQQLRDRGLGAFWASLADIQAIQVFQVSHFQALQSRGQVLCRNAQGQLGQLAFDWSEVTAQVRGALPIFEKVMDTSNSLQIFHGQDKEYRRDRTHQTQDYVNVRDLHLRDRRCILRCYDTTYAFDQSVALTPSATPVPVSVREKWNTLLSQLAAQLPHAPLWEDFLRFVETADTFATSLGNLNPHIAIERLETTHWDPAFHLYSCLIFLTQTSPKVTGAP